MKVKLMLVLLFTFQCFYSFNSYAQQTNFQVSPPPIPWFEFSRGQKDLKAGATMLYMTGKVDDPDYGGDVDVYGGGVNAFYRYAFRDKFAFDAGGLLVGAAGDVGDYTKMKMGLASFPLDLEFQPVKNEKFTIIIFGGFNFSWCYINIDFDGGTDWAEVDITTSMYGPQGGLQVAIKYNNFVFIPFFMITRLSGNASIDIESSDGPYSGSAGVGTTTSNFYGIDIVYLPWDLTLSSIIQQAMSSGSNKNYTTYVLTVSYHFQIETGEASKGDSIEAEAVDRKQLNRKGGNKKIQ